MWKRMNSWVERLVCHRVIHCGLAGVYLAGYLGVEKGSVCALAFALYAVLAWRG
jgi:hypothetical protein